MFEKVFLALASAHLARQYLKAPAKVPAGTHGFEERPKP